MAQRDPDRYMQGDDGLIVEKVGSWAVDKLELLTDYVFASGAARRGYERTGTAFIDPFCAAGRSYRRDGYLPAATFSLCYSITTRTRCAKSARLDQS